MILAGADICHRAADWNYERSSCFDESKSCHIAPFSTGNNKIHGCAAVRSRINHCDIMLANCFALLTRRVCVGSNGLIAWQLLDTLVLWCEPPPYLPSHPHPPPRQQCNVVSSFLTTSIVEIQSASPIIQCNMRRLTTWYLKKKYCICAQSLFVLTKLGPGRPTTSLALSFFYLGFNWRVTKWPRIFSNVYVHQII